MMNKLRKSISVNINYIKGNFPEFSNTVTIDGFSNLARSSTKLEELFWLLIISFSTCGLGYFVIHDILNYISFDVVTNIKMIQEHEMLLPTITICNMNSYKNNMNYSIEDMLVYCKYENTFCTTPKQFNEVKISSYKCYTFNNLTQLYKTSRRGK